MMNKVRFLQKIGGSLLMLLLFAACSQDESLTTGTLLPEGKYPLELTAGVLEVSEKPVSRSSTNENIWETGDKVALQVVGDNNVYSYSTADYGLEVELTSENPYYWKSTKDIAVKAWMYGDNVFRNTLTEWKVQSNQDDDLHANYQNSDLIYAPAKTAKFNGNNELTFYHQTAKIVVHVYNKEIVEGKDGRNITLAIGTNDNPIALGGTIQEPADGDNM